MGRIPIGLVGLLALLALAAACGGAPKPAYQLSQTQSAIGRAEGIGVEDSPQAKLHLKMARDQVREAKQLIVDEKFVRARHLLRRAESDANLAHALAKADETRAEANQAKRELESLREEMNQ